MSVPPGLARLQEVAGGDQAAHARLGKVDVVARLVGWAPASPPQLPLPQEARGARCLAVMQDRQTVIVEDPSVGQSVPIAAAQKRMRFDLAVPDTASNAELNETLARVVVDDWLQHGFDVSVLAMGTTGTGKSVSMFGSAAFGTGAVAREAGFPGLVQTCVSRLLGRAASPADYMLSFAVAEVRPEEGLVDLLARPPAQPVQASRVPGEGDLPSLPLTSVLVHDAEEVQAALEAGQQRSVSWEQAAASKTTLVPKPGASHVLVRLGVLHVPSGTLAHLGVLDTAGWPETRTPTAHDSPSAHNQVNGKDGYHLRSWLRALGGASRGGEQQQEEQGRPLRGAALHGRATALPETRQSQLNALVSLMVLGNAKAFFLGFTSISEQSYFSALRTLQVLRGVSSVKLPLLPSQNATAESLGQVVSLGSILPPPSAARDCAAAQPAPRREQLTSTSRHGEREAKTVDEAAVGSEEDARSDAISVPSTAPAARAMTQATDAPESPALGQGGGPADQEQASSSMAAPSRVEEFVARPLQPRLFQPPAAVGVEAAQASPAQASPPPKRTSEQIEPAEQGESFLELAAHMSSIIASILEPEQGVEPATAESLSDSESVSLYSELSVPPTWAASLPGQAPGSQAAAAASVGSGSTSSDRGSAHVEMPAHDEGVHRQALERSPQPLSRSLSVSVSPTTPPSEPGQSPSGQLTPSSSPAREAFHSALLAAGFVESMDAAVEESFARPSPPPRSSAKSRVDFSAVQASAAADYEQLARADGCPSPSLRSTGFEEGPPDAGAFAPAPLSIAAPAPATAADVSQRVSDILARHAAAGRQLGSAAETTASVDAHAPGVSSGQALVQQEEVRLLRERQARLRAENADLRSKAQSLAAQLKETAAAAVEAKLANEAELAGAHAETKAAKAAVSSAARSADEALWAWYDGRLDAAEAKLAALRADTLRLDAARLRAELQGADVDEVQGDSLNGSVEGDSAAPSTVSVPVATWNRMKRQHASQQARISELEGQLASAERSQRLGGRSCRRLGRLVRSLAKAQAEAVRRACEAASHRDAMIVRGAQGAESEVLLQHAQQAAVAAGQQVAALQGELHGLRCFLGQEADSVAATGRPDASLARALRSAVQGKEAPQAPSPRVAVDDVAELVPWDPPRLPARRSARGSSGADPLQAAFTDLLQDAAGTAPSLVPRLQALQRTVQGTPAATGTGTHQETAPPPPPPAPVEAKAASKNPRNTSSALAKSSHSPSRLPLAGWAGAWAQGLRG